MQAIEGTGRRTKRAFQRREGRMRNTTLNAQAPTGEGISQTQYKARRRAKKGWSDRDQRDFASYTKFYKNALQAGNSEMSEERAKQLLQYLYDAEGTGAQLASWGGTAVGLSKVGVRLSWSVLRTLSWDAPQTILNFLILSTGTMVGGPAGRLAVLVARLNRGPLGALLMGCGLIYNGDTIASTLARFVDRGAAVLLSGVEGAETRGLQGAIKGAVAQAGIEAGKETAGHFGSGALWLKDAAIYGVGATASLAYKSGRALAGGSFNLEGDDPMEDYIYGGVEAAQSFTSPAPDLTPLAQRDHVKALLAKLQEYVPEYMIGFYEFIGGATGAFAVGGAAVIFSAFLAWRMGNKVGDIAETYKMHKSRLVHLAGTAIGLENGSDPTVGMTQYTRAVREHPIGNFYTKYPNLKIKHMKGMGGNILGHIETEILTEAMIEMSINTISTETLTFAQFLAEVCFYFADDEVMEQLRGILEYNMDVFDDDRIFRHAYLVQLVKTCHSIHFIKTLLNRNNISDKELHELSVICFNSHEKSSDLLSAFEILFDLGSHSPFFNVLFYTVALSHFGVEIDVAYVDEMQEFVARHAESRLDAGTIEEDHNAATAFIMMLQELAQYMHAPADEQSIARFCNYDGPKWWVGDHLHL